VIGYEREREREREEAAIESGRGMREFERV
jgi:hypothetical protein